MALQIVCIGAPMIKQIVVSSIKNDAKMKQKPTALQGKKWEKRQLKTYTSAPIKVIVQC